MEESDVKQENAQLEEHKRPLSFFIFMILNFIAIGAAMIGLLIAFSEFAINLLLVLIILSMIVPIYHFVATTKPSKIIATGIIVICVTIFIVKTQVPFLFFLYLALIIAVCLFMYYLWQGYKWARIIYIGIAIVSIVFDFIGEDNIVVNFSDAKLFSLILRLLMFLYILFNEDVQIYCRK